VCRGSSKNRSGAQPEAEQQKQCSGAIKDMDGRQLHPLDGVQWSLKTVRRQLADINWQGVP